MHYCFLSTGTWENASFVRLRELGHELSNRGHAVSYVVDDMPDNRRDLRLPAQANIEYVPRGTKSEMSERRQKLKKLSPDYVHVLNPYTKAFLALVTTKHRVVGDWDEWPAMRPHSFFNGIVERFLDRWLRKRALVPVVCSRYLQNEFRQRYALETTYIPYATYLEPKPDGLSPFTKPTAVYMGTFYPAYDHDLLFDAATILARQGFHVPLRFLGGGPDLEKWQSIARERGLSSVEFSGMLRGDPLWQNLRHAHVLLFPIREHLLNLCRCPSKTFAYMQAKRPIITNRVGEVAEALGEKATYVEATPQAFARSIGSAMKAAAMPDVVHSLEEFTWSKRAEELLRTLELRR